MSVETPVAPASSQRPQVERCNNCHAPTAGFEVCRACGFYSKLGQFVEIDHEIEGFEVEKEPEPFRLPKWTVMMIAGSVGIIAEASALAFVLPMNTYERLICSILHISLGLLAVIVAQTRATFLAMVDDTSLAFLDCLAWPPKAWEAVIRRLPDSANLLTMVSCGTISILMSLFVLRAIPYGAVFNGEPAPKYESKILQTVLANAPTDVDSDMSLEEAIESFTDHADQDLEPEDLLEAAIRQELEGYNPEPIVYTARCIVIGYNVSESNPNQVSSVIVATANRDPLDTNKWKILGSMPITDEQEATRLFKELSPNKQKEPFVHTNMQGSWVKPSVRCEVAYEEQGEDRRPFNLELSKVY